MRLMMIYLISLLTFVTTNLYGAASTKTILVMGDSLSAGYGIDPALGWVNLIQQKLSAAASKNQSWNMINGSVSGETSSGGLARLDGLLKAHHPEIVIIELGANDGLRGQPIKLMQQNLQAMIAASKTSGAKVLLLGMQIPSNYGARYTGEFKQTFQTLADKNNIPLVPFMLTGVAANPEYIQSDGLHPNVIAQPIIVNNIWPTLEKMLQ